MVSGEGPRAGALRLAGGIPWTRAAAVLRSAAAPPRCKC